MGRPGVRLIGLAALLLAAMALLSPTQALAGSLASNGKIVFVSDRDVFSQIYVMNEDGTGQVSLSGDPSAMYFSPAWSPDGTRIAFVSTRDGNNEIYVMNADGSGQVRLTDHWATDGFPSWSPDGTRIAFSSTRDGTWDIWTMAVDGSDLVNVTDNDAFNAMPVWSPDGTRIAFEATYGLGLRTDIYVMSSDGTAVERLTATRGRSETDPAWSPDGTLIAFTVNRARGGTIDTVDVATGVITEVVRGYDPAWSPDGLNIAFTSFSTGGDIFVVDADGSNRRRLTDDADVDKAPHWQPLP